MKVLFKSFEELKKEYHVIKISDSYVINDIEITNGMLFYLGKIVEGYYKDDYFVVDYRETYDFWGKFPIFIIKDEVIKETHTYIFKSGKIITQEEELK